MPAVQRVGDRNEAGGVILAGDPTVLVNGRPVAVLGDLVSPHPCCGQQGCPPVHCSAKTVNNLSTVLVNGKPIILANDTDTCGHKRVSGSPDVIVG